MIRRQDPGPPPNSDLVKRFEAAGGKGKPRYGQLTVCYASSQDTAMSAVRKCWPNAGIGGDLMTDLPLPSRFEQIVKLMDPTKITEEMPLGPDSGKHIEGIKKFIEAGFDHVYVHQVGPQEEEFFLFHSQEVIPKFAKAKASGNGLHPEEARH
jgi:coenzyme F420-dependent glucose-6-phosphate dehydrogenase